MTRPVLEICTTTSVWPPAPSTRRDAGVAGGRPCVLLYASPTGLANALDGPGRRTAAGRGAGPCRRKVRGSFIQVAPPDRRYYDSARPA